jgi:hypothetical protein
MEMHPLHCCLLREVLDDTRFSLQRTEVVVFWLLFCAMKTSIYALSRCDPLGDGVAYVYDTRRDEKIKYSERCDCVHFLCF